MIIKDEVFCILNSYELNDVSGVGPKTLETLKNAGIKSVNQLANSSINQLKQLDGIGKKSAEKFINGAKKLLAKPSETISEIPKPQIKTSNSTIQQIQSDIKLIFSKLERFDQRLKAIENEVQSSIPISETNISDDHFFRVLKSSYNSMTKKFGGFVPISDLTQTIKQQLPISEESIHQKIYSLFMDYKVELQPGKSDHGAPLVQDGKKFVWFKLK